MCFSLNMSNIFNNVLVNAKYQPLMKTADVPQVEKSNFNELYIDLFCCRCLHACFCCVIFYLLKRTLPYTATVVYGAYISYKSRLIFAAQYFRYITLIFLITVFTVLLLRPGSILQRCDIDYGIYFLIYNWTALKVLRQTFIYATVSFSCLLVITKMF